MMKNLIKNAVYSMFRNHDLDTEKFRSSIEGITKTCMFDIEEHPELFASLTDSESALRYFVEQKVLESWLLHKELLEKLTGNALYPPEGVEKGSKLYEAYHEGIIEHEVKDIFICIETDKANVMASGIGDNYFTCISGAINAIEKANAALEADTKPEKFNVGDKVRIAYISDCNPHNGKIGTITWLHDYKYYPNGAKGDCLNFEIRTQGKITYDDGTAEGVGNFYRKGSGLVSPVEKVK